MNRVRCSLTRAFLCTGVLMFLAAALPAFGQTCIQDEYNSFNGLTSHPKTLSCTANDVSVSKVTGVSVINPDGTVSPGGKCFQGSTFSFIADFQIQTTSNKTRSNVGLFFGTGASNISNGQALTGTCSNSILAPSYQPAGTSYTLGNGSPAGTTLGGYEELDQAIDGETTPNGCGDTSSTDNNGTGTQFAELEVDNVSCPLTAILNPCPDPTVTGSCMALPECTGWYQPTTTMPPCTSPSHAWVPAAVPGTTSKCNCTTLYIPVQLIEPAVSVAKNCNIGSDTTKGLTSCDAGPEGNQVTYTVTITNTTPAGEFGVVVDQICDNRYGAIYDDGAVTTACPTGTIGHSFVTGTTCGSGTVGDIANGGVATCIFTVNHGENLSVTDQVSVAGHSDKVSTATFTGATNTVTVTSSDAPTTEKTSKGVEPAPTYACVTVRYNVTAQNTSAADESVTVSSIVSPYTPALNDSYFGDITTDHGSNGVAGSVTGTTCGVASGSLGLGTLSTVTASSSNGGAFPQTLAAGSGTPPTSDGGKYQCQFDGVICGTPAPIAGVCGYGLQNLDKVTANLTGDDVSPADIITQSSPTLTADVCFTVSAQ